MGRCFLLIYIFMLAILPNTSYASGNFANDPAPAGLTIHGTEIGVGKFHRYSNSLHAYSPGNAWTPFILGANAPLDKTSSIVNADGSYTIFFLTLEDFIATATQIAKSTGKAISVLNLHGHGIPGAMWFPATLTDYNSADCGSWHRAAEGADEDNYSQYYSLPDSDEINTYHSLGDNPSSEFTCTTGLSQWQTVVAKNPEFKQVLTDDVQIAFLSCLVGLGTVGDTFTKGIANLLVRGNGRVEASTNFGLGDWSMEKGLGFWDFVSDDQLEHDRSVYPQTHRDADIKQKGILRVARSLTSSQLLADQETIPVVYERDVHGVIVPEPVPATSNERLPSRIRVPGTNAYITNSRN